MNRHKKLKLYILSIFVCFVLNFFMSQNSIILNKVYSGVKVAEAAEKNSGLRCWRKSPDSDFYWENCSRKLTKRSTGDSLEEVILGPANLILDFSIALTVLFIIIGGILYGVSGVSEKTKDKGKKTITFAIIGLIVILISKGAILFWSEEIVKWIGG